jgi:small subunit ribosomal protein S4
MQSRQMMTHGHWLLNGIKHNIPSYYMKPGDVLTLRKSLQNSALYSRDDVSVVVPFWIQTSKADYSVSLIQYPTADNREMPADLLKVIEFYARV